MVDQEAVLEQPAAQDPPTEVLAAVPDLPERYAAVWPHTLDQVERFPDAVAQVLPNGTLLVMRPGSRIPVKGYAPGAWLTFEHVGDYRAPERPAETVPQRVELTDAERDRYHQRHADQAQEESEPESEVPRHRTAEYQAARSMALFADMGDERAARIAIRQTGADPDDYDYEDPQAPRPKDAGADRRHLIAVPDRPAFDDLSGASQGVFVRGRRLWPRSSRA